MLWCFCSVYRSLANFIEDR